VFQLSQDKIYNLNLELELDLIFFLSTVFMMMQLQQRFLNYF